MSFFIENKLPLYAIVNRGVAIEMPLFTDYESAARVAKRVSANSFDGDLYVQRVRQFTEYAVSDNMYDTLQHASRGNIKDRVTVEREIEENMRNTGQPYITMSDGRPYYVPLGELIRGKMIAFPLTTVRTL